MDIDKQLLFLQLCYRPNSLILIAEGKLPSEGHQGKLKFGYSTIKTAQNISCRN